MCRQMSALSRPAVQAAPADPIETLFDRAQELGAELAAMPPLAVAGVLETIVGFEGRTLEQSLEDERRAVTRTWGTEDQQEGMMAFLEKRRPVFHGR